MRQEALESCGNSLDFSTLMRVGTDASLFDEPILANVTAGNLSINGPILAHPMQLESNARYENITRASQWIQDCEETHHECCLSSEVPPLPSRILDVNRLANDNCIRLVSGQGMHGAYVTLSHCWGSGPTVTTTKSTLADREKSFPLNTLPRLFRDAVHFVRELSLDYLWIDALCILQDDWQDWENEAACMADIFQNSKLTIAATTAVNSSRGLYPSNPTAELRFLSPSSNRDITWRFELLPRAKAVDDILFAPLNRRGWVLQELMLYRRVLHFSKHQLY